MAFEEVPERGLKSKPFAHKRSPPPLFAKFRVFLIFKLPCGQRAISLVRVCVCNRKWGFVWVVPCCHKKKQSITKNKKHFAIRMTICISKQNVFFFVIPCILPNYRKLLFADLGFCSFKFTTTFSFQYLSFWLSSAFSSLRLCPSSFWIPYVACEPGG